MKALRGMTDRGFIQRIFQLGGIAVCKIDAIVVLFPQHVQKHGGLEPPEAVAQRELIERV